MPENHLYYGDNLDVLRRYIADESVDLVYLDPPFNSNATYNVLFAEHGEKAASQIKAFEDTWTWDDEAARTYFETVQAGGEVANALKAFYTLLSTSNMMAYLAMMAPRLVELRRVLKPTGSIYLHCDPTASHYLKLLMDAVFDPSNFRNEIVWRRTGSHAKVARFGPIHDTILFYTKTGDYVWKGSKRPYMKGHVEHFFKRDDEGWRTNYYGNVLTGSGTRNGESGLPWRGFDPTAKGRHWAVPRALVDDCGEDLSAMSQHEKLDRLYELGYIKIEPGAVWPIYEHRLRPEDGTPAPDIWAYQPYTQGTVFGSDGCIDEDVRWLSTQDQERLGYPTQKPEPLLERIIRASSNEGDVVLDPFCGCGTAVAVAHRLNRRWVGIDITHLAVNLMKHRLMNTFGESVKAEYGVTGEPVSVEGARQLAKDDPYQFQWWALGLVGARPVEQKKGADKGIDGRIVFHEGDPTDLKQVILSVKAGANLHRNMVHELRGVIDREGAAIGVLITMQPPTKPMREEAASAGFYQSPWGTHPRIQLFTVAALLDGMRIDAPPMGQVGQTFKKAPKAARGGHETLALELGSLQLPTLSRRWPHTGRIGRLSGLRSRWRRSGMGANASTTRRWSTPACERSARALNSRADPQVSASKLECCGQRDRLQLIREAHLR